LKERASLPGSDVDHDVIRKLLCSVFNKQTVFISRCKI